ncbi:MAG: type II toxin-antitoxin system RelE/ParE family toxin [Dehalococcoidia bacterium]
MHAPTACASGARSYVQRAFLVGVAGRTRTLVGHSVVFYATERGEQPVRSYLDRVGRSGRVHELARIHRTIDLLVEFGSQLPQFGSVSRQLKGTDGLYELRCGSHRIAYGEDRLGRFVLLHAWKKETRKTTKTDLRTARRRHADWIEGDSGVS